MCTENSFPRCVLHKSTCPCSSINAKKETKYNYRPHQKDAEGNSFTGVCPFTGATTSPNHVLCMEYPQSCPVPIQELGSTPDKTRGPPPDRTWTGIPLPDRNRGYPSSPSRRTGPGLDSVRLLRSRRRTISFYHSLQLTWTLKDILATFSLVGGSLESPKWFVWSFCRKFWARGWDLRMPFAAM